MKNIIPPINTPDGKFTDGNGSTIRGTPVTSVWLNNVQGATIDMQNEIANVIKGANLTINPDNPSQLLEAIEKISEVGIPSATTTQKGIVKLNSAVNSALETEASTPKAVKTAYDKGAEALTVANSKAPLSHVHTIAEITNLQTTLDGKATTTHNHDTVYAKIVHTHTDLVPTTRKINGMPLTGDITITSSEIGGAPVSHTHTITDITGLSTDLANKVPVTRKINNKALSTDITLTATDIGAASTTHTHAIAQITGLQTALDGKATTSHTHADLVPTSRKINGKALTADISLVASDVGASATTHTHTWAQVTDAPNATTTARGLTRLEDSVSSLSTSTAATPKSVKTAYDQATSAYNLAKQVSFGTQWKRAQITSNITYTNNSASPIFYLMTLDTTSSLTSLTIFVDNVEIGSVYMSQDVSSFRLKCPISFIVPSGSTYKIVGQTLTASWL